MIAELVQEIRAKFPTIQRLDYTAEMIDGKVVLEGRYVGISDKQEGGYIRTEGEATTEQKRVASCLSDTQVTQSYCLVIGFRGKSLVGYVDRLIGVVSQRRFRTEIEGMVLSKHRIIEEEASEAKSWNDSYKLVKLQFSAWRTIAGSNCETVECE